MNRRGFLGLTCKALTGLPLVTLAATLAAKEERPHYIDCLHGHCQVCGCSYDQMVADNYIGCPGPISGMQLLMEAQEAKNREWWNRVLKDFRDRAIKAQAENYYAIMNPATQKRLGL